MIRILAIVGTLSVAACVGPAPILTVDPSQSEGRDPHVRPDLPSCADRSGADRSGGVRPGVTQCRTDDGGVRVTVCCMPPDPGTEPRFPAPAARGVEHGDVEAQE